MPRQTSILLKASRYTNRTARLSWLLGYWHLDVQNPPRCPNFPQQPSKIDFRSVRPDQTSRKSKKQALSNQQPFNRFFNNPHPHSSPPPRRKSDIENIPGHYFRRNLPTPSLHVAWKHFGKSKEVWKSTTNQHLSRPNQNKWKHIKTNQNKWAQKETLI